MNFTFFSYLPYRWYNRCIKNSVSEEYKKYNSYLNKYSNVGFLSLIGYILYIGVYLLCCALFKVNVSLLWGIFIIPGILLLFIFIMLDIEMDKDISSTHEKVVIECNENGVTITEVLPYHTISEKNKNRISELFIEYSDIVSVKKYFEDNDVYGAVGNITYKKGNEIIRENGIVKSEVKRYEDSFIFSVGTDIENHFVEMQKYIEDKKSKNHYEV